MDITKLATAFDKKHKFITSPANAPLLVASGCPWDYLPLVNALWPSVLVRFSTACPQPRNPSVALCAGVICVVNGLRVSEVLGLEKRHVTKTGLVIVPARKGSQARSFQLPLDVADVIRNSDGSRESKLFPVKYSWVRKALIDNGVGVLLPGYMNRRITHAGRHCIADSVIEAEENALTGEILGHRTKGAAQWYNKEVDLAKDRERKRVQRMAK